MGEIVTDPALLQKLNDPNTPSVGGTVVTDPDLLAKLNAPGNVVHPTSFADGLKSIGMGLARGAAEIPGLPFDIANLGNLAYGKVFDPEIEKIARNRLGGGGFGSNAISNALDRAGFSYKPEGDAAKDMYNVAHFAGGAVGGGLASSLIKGGTRAVTGGAVREVAREAAKSVPKDLFVGTTGGIGSEVAGHAADGMGITAEHTPWGHFAATTLGALFGGAAGGLTQSFVGGGKKTAEQALFDSAGVRPRFGSDLTPEGQQQGYFGRLVSEGLPDMFGAQGTSSRNAQKTQDELSGYVGKTLGEAPTKQQLGQRVQTTADSMVERLNDDTRAGYKSLDGIVHPDEPVVFHNTQNAIHDVIGRVDDPDVQNLLKNPMFERLAPLVGKQDLSWKDLDAVRQEIGATIPTAQGSEKALLKRVYSAIIKDQDEHVDTNSLFGEGHVSDHPDYGLMLDPDAARATGWQPPSDKFQAARDKYKANRDLVDDYQNTADKSQPEMLPDMFLAPGPKGATKLDALLEHLSPEDRASLTRDMLSVKARNAQGDFDMPTLMQWWERQSPEMQKSLSADPTVKTTMETASRIWNATENSRKIAGRPATGITDHPASAIAGGLGAAAMHYGAGHELLPSLATSLAFPAITHSAASVAQNPAFVSALTSGRFAGTLPGAATGAAINPTTLFPDTFHPVPQPAVDRPTGGQVQSWLGTTDRNSAQAYINEKLGAQVGNQLTGLDDAGFKAAMFNLSADPKHRQMMTGD